MSILIVAEHDGARLSGATRCAVTAAARIGGSIDVLVAGAGVDSVAKEAASILGVARVLKAEAAHFAQPTSEALTALVLSLAGGRTHILFSSTALGKGTAPRVAVLLDVAQLSDVAAVVDSDTFVRPIYAGSVLATFRSRDAVKVITVRTTNFDAAPATGGGAAIEAVAVPDDPAISKVVRQETSKSDRPDLVGARVVISGGRGFASAENYQKLLEPLANAMGAALGASRAAVDAGYTPSDYQVGQTGKIVAPDLYVAIGISGAIQHLAGMKESKVIVAINKDPEAPIFQIADYGLVGDLFQIVPELTQQVSQGAS